MWWCRCVRASWPGRLRRRQISRWRALKRTVIGADRRARGSGENDLSCGHCSVPFAYLALASAAYSSAAS
jgi:hypothetical protein